MKARIALFGLLAASLLGITISDASAISKQDYPGHEKLLPKSFGQKTKTLVCGEKLCSDSSDVKKFDGIKKHEIKNYKKLVEQYKAKANMRI